MSSSLELFEISRLQARYGDVVTRQAWDELEALFAPGAPVTIDTRDRSGDRAGRRGRGRRVHREGDRAVRALRVRHAQRRGRPRRGRRHRDRSRRTSGRFRADRGTGRWTNAFGLYEDRYAKLGERWVIAQRSYSSLARTAPDLEVFGFPP